MIRSRKTQLFLFFLSIVLGVLGLMQYRSSYVKSTQSTQPTELKDTKINSKKTDLFIHTWQSDVGLNVDWVENHELPIIDLELCFRAGSAYDGQWPGLSRLVLVLLESGTQKKDAQELAEAFEQDAVHFGLGSNRDQACLSVRMPSDPKLQKKVAELLNEILTQPRFAELDLAREKKNRLSHLKDQAQDPGAVTGLAFQNLLLPNQAYGLPVLGTLESVSAITNTQIQDFFKKYFVVNNAQMTVVGDIRAAEVQNLAELIFKNVPTGEAAGAVAIPAAQSQVGLTESEVGSVTKIPFPSSQAHVYTGQVVLLPMNHPDYYPLAVGNYILGGGGFSSRLMKLIRVKNGLAYSVHSGFDKYAGLSCFEITLQTKAEQAEQALSLTNETLQAWALNGPTEEELKLAKNYLSGVFPLSLSSNAKQLGMVSRIRFYDLPKDYLKEHSTRINQVTHAQVIETFKKYCAPDQMKTVMLGV